MKALNKLDSVDKGKLFAGWFPDEMQGFVEAVKGAYEYMVAHEAEIRETGEGVIYNVDFWFKVAANVAAAIEQYGKRLAKNQNLFADQLFDGYNALFTVDCLYKYQHKTNNPKFVQAVRLLFD
jgi:ABC-type nitrate/sulfonate/bicarbonate transport system substrate-binding protein